MYEKRVRKTLMKLTPVVDLFLDFRSYSPSVATMAGMKILDDSRPYHVVVDVVAVAAVVVVTTTFDALLLEPLPRAVAAVAAW